MTLVSVGKCYFLAYVCTRIEEPGKTTDKTEGEEEEDFEKKKKSEDDGDDQEKEAREQK